MTRDVIYGRTRKIFFLDFLGFHKISNLAFTASLDITIDSMSLTTCLALCMAQTDPTHVAIIHETRCICAKGFYFSLSLCFGLTTSLITVTVISSFHFSLLISRHYQLSKDKNFKILKFIKKYTFTLIGKMKTTLFSNKIKFLSMCLTVNKHCESCLESSLVFAIDWCQIFCIT